ncbi:flagellar hook-associated protein 1 FlgK [Methylopila capsulata]|uniref:Flagellar hook-associated protein 1 n=1 Tax=Methylopila capsulata TaxID=61654 RepID=A0A9W6IR36_9HYPH|nr:flagellar hook-associated protein FlgK [Methylopila capsulata]MBM7851069.1 flagellar hook-associated protein 1 FlgK [Methylopila capsulata]GLK54127.1 flagellar hook-associated protein FlgK [Methylopila capsulata]
MGLSASLSTALSGLRTTQAGLDLVANNVANASTPGYVAKSLTTEQSATGGVKVTEVKRQIDLYLQRQLRSESATSANASTKADYLDQLQSLFSTVDGDTSIDSLVSSLSSAFDALATSPDSTTTQGSAVQEAVLLAQALNDASNGVQGLRQNADDALASGVDVANEALTSIQDLSRKIVASNDDGTRAALQDQRDQAINELAALMDVKVTDTGSGDVRIATTSGLTLYDAGEASRLSFEPTSNVTPQKAYSDDASESTLGTITLTRSSGYSADLLADGGLKSGELRALAELRDETLPEAQAQLDELAANLAQAFGSTTVAGAAVTGGVDLSTAGAQPGDTMTVSYTSGGKTRTVTLVNVTDPARLPLHGGVTADPDDTVIGVDFASATAADDIDAALAAAGIDIDAAETAGGFAFTASDASVTVAGGSSKITATVLSDDGVALPLFVDAGDAIYSGSLDGGDQRTGFAGRIAVNSAVTDDPALLTAYSSTAAASDSTRADFLVDALKTDRGFRTDAGLGGASSGYSGTIGEFAQDIVAYQASASATATRVSESQSAVVSALQDRYASKSGVDVDSELTNLITLQTAYSANARVMTAVKEMIDMLLQA